MDAFDAVAARTPGAPRLVSGSRPWPREPCPPRTPGYWLRHVREPVRFSEAMGLLAAGGCRLYLEVGPGTTLLALGRACVDAADARWIPSQQPEGHGRNRALAALGQLYVAGVEPAWRSVVNPTAQKMDLPTYPFNRRKYWLQRREAPVVQGHEFAPPCWECNSRCLLSRAAKPSFPATSASVPRPTWWTIASANRPSFLPPATWRLAWPWPPRGSRGCWRWLT